MKRITNVVAILVAAIFLVGCGTIPDTELVPLDEGSPVPGCVSITFFDRDNFDNSKKNKTAGTYCKEEFKD